MITISRMLIGLLSLILFLVALLGFVFSGVMTGYFGLPADSGFMLLFLPAIGLIISIFGFWATISNSRAGLIAFSIFSLTFWYIGTLVGVVCLLLLLCSPPTEAEDSTSLSES